MHNRWGILVAVYIGSLAATLNQFKVPPLMEILREQFHMTPVLAGWLMSSFALTGFILSLPTGVFLHIRYLKVAGIAGLSFLTVGSLLGIIATSPGVMLVGRIYEGMGLLTMGVVAPSLINTWFSEDEKGLPMGIWATWVPAGSVIMLNLALPLYNLGSWRAAWWFGFIIGLLALLIFIIMIDLPVEFKREQNNNDRTFNWSEIITIWRSKDIWLLAFMFMTYNFTMVGYNSWAPTYLRETFALTPSRAAFYTSLVHVAVIPANIIAGYLMNFLKSARKIYVGGFIVYTLAWFIAFNLRPAIIAPFMLALGLIAGFIPAATFAAAPQAIDKKGRITLARVRQLLGKNDCFLDEEAL
ncbi:hypothetical protein MHOCP_22140 [Moorella humiferrea]|uniref:MFS transporter n=1 Tax=Neomoorella humiferrea TaxID=676965 RepID=UPI0030D2F61D